MLTKTRDAVRNGSHGTRSGSVGLMERLRKDEAENVYPVRGRVTVYDFRVLDDGEVVTLLEDPWGRSPLPGNVVAWSEDRRLFNITVSQLQNSRRCSQSIADCQKRVMEEKYGLIAIYAFTRSRIAVLRCLGIKPSE